VVFYYHDFISDLLSAKFNLPVKIDWEGSGELD